jgi:V/A-type H+-transporting ATPase subunit K
MKSRQQIFKRKIIGFTILLGVVILSVFCVNVVKAVAQQNQIEEMNSSASGKTAAVQTEMIQPPKDPGVIKFGFFTAALAVSLGALGAAIAVGYVGAAAMGAIGEKPELAGRALIFVGLAEGIAIYGLIIAIMILGKI